MSPGRGSRAGNLRRTALVCVFLLATGSLGAFTRVSAQSEQAESIRLTDLLDRHCTGAGASSEGLGAYRGLVDIALAAGDGDEARRLSRWIEEHHCTFASGRRWRPAGAFATAVIEVHDPALRALAERAWASERDEDTQRALHAYLELARRSGAASTSADALSRAAGLLLARGDRETLVRAVRHFLRDARNAGVIDARLDVQLALTSLLVTMGDRESEARASRDAALSLAESVAFPPSWPIARSVATARLERATEDFASLEPSLVVEPGPQATVRSFVQAIRDQIHRNAERVREFEASLVDVRVHEERIPALVLVARAYDALARGIANAVLLPQPDDLQRRIRGAALPQHQVQIQFEDQVRQVLSEQVHPVRCVAVARYAQALADAETLRVEHDSLRIARDRLRASADDVEGCLSAEPRLLRVALAAASTPALGLTQDDATHGPPALARAE